MTLLNLDLAVAIWDNTIAILIGDGRGRFVNGSGSPVNVYSDDYTAAVATTEFNRDGNLDLAVLVNPGARIRRDVWAGFRNDRSNARSASTFIIREWRNYED